MKQLFLMLVLGALLLPAELRAAEGMREGLWEITSLSEMSGMPMKIPATTIRHCYTKEDVKDQKKVIAREKNCTLTDYKVTGNKVVWAMKCTGQNAGSFKGETTFGPDVYSSIMKMKSKGYDMTMRVKAKRIGACP